MGDSERPSWAGVMRESPVPDNEPTLQRKMRRGAMVRRQALASAEHLLKVVQEAILGPARKPNPSRP